MSSPGHFFLGSSQYAGLWARLRPEEFLSQMLIGSQLNAFNCVFQLSRHRYIRLRDKEFIEGDWKKAALRMHSQELRRRSHDSCRNSQVKSGKACC